MPPIVLDDPTTHPRPGQWVACNHAVFQVVKRRRDQGQCYLIAGNGDCFPIGQCKFAADAKRQNGILHRPDDPYLNKTYVYAGDTAKLQKQFSDVKLTVLAHNGAFAQCKGSNGAYYMWVPLDKLNPAK